MKLLIETIPDFSESNIEQIIVEETNGKIKKDYYITGPFLQSEIKNKNGRVYPKKVLCREVTRYTSEKIDKSLALGELDHPDTPHINLDRVSHRIISLREEGNNFIGKAKILDEDRFPRAKIVRGLIEEGIRFGVSSRCLGSLKHTNGVNIVCEDLYMITPADIVSDPSAPDAFVTALKEYKEWAWEGGQLIEREIEIKKIINKLSMRNEKEFLELFREILK